MRPRGEITLAIERMLTERGSVTLDEVVRGACTSRAAAKYTLNYMHRTQRVQVIAQRHVAWSCRPLNVYGLSPAAGVDAGEGIKRAMAAFGCWARPPGASVSED